MFEGATYKEKPCNVFLVIYHSVPFIFIVFFEGKNFGKCSGFMPILPITKNVRYTPNYKV